MTLLLSEQPASQCSYSAGGAWHEFIELFRDAFDFDDEIKLIPGDFRLKHRCALSAMGILAQCQNASSQTYARPRPRSVYGVLYTGFELDDLYDGAIVELVWPSRYKEKLHQHHEEQGTHPLRSSVAAGRSAATHQRIMHHAT